MSVLHLVGSPLHQNGVINTWLYFSSSLFAPVLFECLGRCGFFLVWICVKPVLLFNGLLAENSYFSKQQQSCAVGSRQINLIFHGINDISPKWGHKVEFQCTVWPGLYILTLTKQAGAPCFKSDLFFHKTISMLTFSSPTLPVALSQGSSFLLLQEAANMLRLIQNRLKEEEQHLLKSGGEWDFLLFLE